MQKFTFENQEKTIIRHNIVPEFLIQVIMNREDDQLDLLNDCFEMFEFRGNEIILKWLATQEELEEIEDFSHIRSILRRAWQFYRSNVFIEKYEKEPVKFESDKYILQSRSDGKGWVATDKINKIVISFDNRKFNETQQITLLEDFNHDNYMKLASYLQELAAWLSVNHSDKV